MVLSASQRTGKIPLFTPSVPFVLQIDLDVAEGLEVQSELALTQEMVDHHTRMRSCLLSCHSRTCASKEAISQKRRPTFRDSEAAILGTVFSDIGKPQEAQNGPRSGKPGPTFTGGTVPH